MTPDMLRGIGEAIYGPEWQRALARALGPRHPDGPRESLDDRLVRRWASGDRSVPSWVPDALAEMLVEEAGEMHLRAAECLRLADELRRA
jgi:hypothetical protein